MLQLQKGGGGGLRIFLHSAQFFLSVLTIVGLHLNTSLWDYDSSSHFAKKWHKQQSVPARKQPPGTGTQVVTYVSVDSEGNPVAPTTYFSGALWGAVIGLLGIAALVVFVLSWILRLPKTLLTVYYLICACIIIIVSSFGLGWNWGVGEYNKCMDKLAKGAKLDGDADARERTFFQTTCVENLRAYVLPRFTTYLISCVHAAVYLASFYVSFTDKTSCPYRGVNPAQPVMTPHPEYNQMSVQNSAVQENPDQIPA